MRRGADDAHLLLHQILLHDLGLGLIVRAQDFHVLVQVAVLRERDNENYGACSILKGEEISHLSLEVHDLRLQGLDLGDKVVKVVFHLFCSAQWLSPVLLVPLGLDLHLSLAVSSPDTPFALLCQLLFEILDLKN